MHPTATPTLIADVYAVEADDTLDFISSRKLTLEDALEYIGEDELVEITPESIRLRKKVL